MTDLLVPVDPAAALAASGSSRTSRLTVGLDLTALGIHQQPRQGWADDPRAQVDLGRVAEIAALADRDDVAFIAFDDTFTLSPSPTRTSASRLDAARVACRLAPVTSRAGLVATIDPGFLDPVHVATAIGTLHERSRGRGGWQVGTAPARSLGNPAEAWQRLGTDVRRVIRAWGDGSAHADTARPRVVVRVDSAPAAAAAGTFADVARIEARDAAEARALRSDVRRAASAAGRDPDGVRVLVDVVAIISRDAASARVRRDILADITPGEPPWRRTLSHLGTAGQFADLLEAWFTDRVVDGFTVIPGSLPHDVRALVGEVLPSLGERGLVEDVAYPPAA